MPLLYYARGDAVATNSAGLPILTQLKSKPRRLRSICNFMFKQREHGRTGDESSCQGSTPSYLSAIITVLLLMKLPVGRSIAVVQKICHAILKGNERQLLSATEQELAAGRHPLPSSRFTKAMHVDIRNKDQLQFQAIQSAVAAADMACATCTNGIAIAAR